VEEYLFAIADAMHEEYQAIVDAGFLLQVDDPRVVTQYDMIDPAPSIEEFRRAAALRIEAVNRALGDIPPERVRITFAGGAGTGPIPQIFH
jgi:5-methyltetrahydropteroyltriglutamate--homocysteine methyltransferase